MIKHLYKSKTYNARNLKFTLILVNNHLLQYNIEEVKISNLIDPISIIFVKVFLIKN